MPACAPFIYGLYDPRDAGHIRYVGMAFQTKRPIEHGFEAMKSETSENPRITWIRGLLDEGEVYDVEILEQLEEGCSRHFVGLVEQMYIRALRKIGHKLTNVSAGGWGGVTLPSTGHTPESLAKMRAASLGKTPSEEARKKMRDAALRGMTPEKIERLSQARRSISVETRQRITQGNIGRVHTPEERQRISEGQTTAWKNPEVRAKRIEALKERDPEIYKKVAEFHRGRKRSDETRAKMRANANRSPEVRKKMSEAAYRRHHPEQYDELATLTAKIEQLEKQLAVIEGTENAQ
jgi:hypothetical protein